MDAISIPELLWIGGLIFQAAVIAGGGAWAFAKIKEALRDEIQKERREVNTDLAHLENDMRDRMDRVEASALDRAVRAERTSGESIASLREHVHSVEKFVRDHFVKAETFLEYTRGVSTQIKDASDRIEGRLGRIESAVDKIRSGDRRQG